MDKRPQPGIFGVYIQVSDLDRSLSFYRDVLALELDWSDGAIAVLHSSLEPADALVLRHVGYGEHAQTLVVGASGSLEFRVRISSRAIELSPLVVEVVSDAVQARRASGNSLNMIDRPTIDAFSS